MNVYIYAAKSPNCLSILRGVLYSKLSGLKLCTRSRTLGANNENCYIMNELYLLFSFCSFRWITKTLFTVTNYKLFRSFSLMNLINGVFFIFTILDINCSLLYTVWHLSFDAEKPLTINHLFLHFRYILYKMSHIYLTNAMTIVIIITTAPLQQRFKLVLILLGPKIFNLNLYS